MEAIAVVCSLCRQRTPLDSDWLNSIILQRQVVRDGVLVHGGRTTGLDSGSGTGKSAADIQGFRVVAALVSGSGDFSGDSVFRLEGCSCSTSSEQLAGLFHSGSGVYIPLGHCCRHVV